MSKKITYLIAPKQQIQFRYEHLGWTKEQLLADLDIRSGAIAPIDLQQLKLFVWQL